MRTKDVTMAATNDDNVYIKKDKRYIPFGCRINEPYLPDGIWYVHHSKHSYGHTNVDHYLSGVFKVGEDPGFIDIPKICSMQKYVDYVLQSPEFKEILDSGQYSFYTLTAKITALVVDLNEKIKKEETKDGTR